MVASNVMKFIRNVVTISHLVQKLKWGAKNTGRMVIFSLP